jgi:tRNA-Thr(GGU) m(6)t(6)A37 methyltransferase TsaA
MVDEAIFKPIGIIHTPFKTIEDIPSSTRLGKDVKGTIELKPEFEDGLKDLRGFSHIVLVFHLHKSKGFTMFANPPLDTVKRSLFATRSPARPNSIGISIVRLEKIEKNIMHITNLDMLDGTPLLDIKPYIPHWEPSGEIKIGWLEGKIKRIT